MANGPNSRAAPRTASSGSLYWNSMPGSWKKTCRVPAATVSASYCIEPPDLMFNPGVRTSAPSLSQLSASHCTPTVATTWSAEPVVARVRSVEWLVVAVVISPDSSPVLERLVYGNSIEPPTRKLGATAQPTENVGVKVSKVEWVAYEARCPSAGVVLASAVRLE